MDIVCVSAANSEYHHRTPLLVQALESLKENCKDWSKHSLTVSFDHGGFEEYAPPIKRGHIIFNGDKPGASACRNIGASSVPKYRRQSHVMFIDDDVYMCPGWDEQIEAAMATFYSCVVSGYSHPFNLSHGQYKIGEAGDVCAAQVLSTVCMAMPWEIWDDVGFFAEPGGPGGSEDVDWCARAEKKDVGFAVVEPQCVVHCGLTSSSGQRIVGYDELMAQNAKLIEQHKLSGVIIQ